MVSRLKNESYIDAPSLARGLNDALGDVHHRVTALESVQLAIVGPFDMPIGGSLAAAMPMEIAAPPDMAVLGVVPIGITIKSSNATPTPPFYLDVQPRNGRLYVRSASGFATNTVYTVTLLCVGRAKNA